MTEKELFTEHAKNYLLCYNNQCEKHEQCLRWILKDYVPKEQASVTAVNPLYTDKSGCSLFQSSEKRKMAVGMTKFYDEMPRKKGQSIRDTLEGHFGHTMYYLYRNGERPITPDMQEYIKKVCIRNGWNEEAVYDGFTEEYEW